MVKYDKKNRLVSKEQQAAIHAKLKSRGISVRQLSDKRLTTINDDVIEARGKNESVNEAIDKSLMKIFKLPEKQKETPKVSNAVIVPNAALNQNQRRDITSGKGVKVIDLIKQISLNNGLTHAEARKVLEKHKHIPPGISEDAIVQPQKPIDKGLLKSDEIQFKRLRQAREQSERAVILRKQREREEARRRITIGPDEEGLTKEQLEKADREANRKIVIRAGDLTKEKLEQLERSEIARKNALISGRFQAGKKPEGAERKIQDAAIRKLLERQEQTEKNQKIQAKLGDLRDQRADKFQEFMKESTKEAKIVGGVVIPQKKTVSPETLLKASQQRPLLTPGLVTGVDPLKKSREETTADKIRRRALDLEVISGLSPQLAMDRAKREVVRQQLTR